MRGGVDGDFKRGLNGIVAITVEGIVLFRLSLVSKGCPSHAASKVTENKQHCVAAGGMY